MYDFFFFGGLQHSFFQLSSLKAFAYKEHPDYAHHSVSGNIRPYEGEIGRV